MPSLDDLPLNEPDESESTAPATAETRPAWPWVAGLVALAVVLGGGLLFWLLSARSTVAPAGSSAPRSTPAGPPGGAAVSSAPVIDLPPLDLTDPLVREMVGRLSAAPMVASWLATDGLIRNFVVAVENVAEGRTPARHLRRLAPQGEFRVTKRAGAIAIDPRSYERYNSLADAVASCDAAAIAGVYFALRPRLVEAYKELGHPEGDVDAAVQAAIRHLLETPAVPSDARLLAPAVSYRYADPQIEALSPAQKQLLRMGPRNRQIILEKLRAVAAALGTRPTA